MDKKVSGYTRSCAICVDKLILPIKGVIMKTRHLAATVSITLTLLSTSCLTTSNFVVSNSANIEKYRFATISQVMEYTGSPVLMELDVRVYDALASAGLSVIGEREIDGLSAEDKQALLLAKYSATQDSDESVVSITFIDYLTLRPIATCRGAYGLGWTQVQDMDVAMNKAIEQVKQLFNKSTTP
jgi:hypothetical protein